ncbi:MAG: deoxyribodipyrimidine photolyase [Proteobacteria bacterium]|nr:MAG: deoxyribodipyrimidine photolyase [Pseudomonadota bacterium]
MHLIWLRNDLRLMDNPALTAAVQQANLDGCPLLALFIRCPEQDRLHHRAQSQLQFRDANLADVVERLQTLHIKSFVKTVPLYAAVPDLFAALLQKHPIRSVFFSRDYLVNELKRDDAVLKLLQYHAVEACVSEPAYLLPPQSIERQSGGMYHVFTPYKRQFIQQLKDRYQSPLPMPDKVTCGYAVDVKSETTNNDWQHDWWSVGEPAARKRLSAFVEHNRYQQQRDYPAVSGTSRLSPYLALGIISPRQCLAQALKKHGESAFESTWVSELIWREFYHDLVAHYPRLVKHQTFKQDAMDDWLYDKTIVDAWKNGQTGFPIIDAGMRQLKQQHWMHNRVRMLTASFFTKLCLHDWRIGEQYFMEQLIDGDFASNNGGWQWSSASGCDAAPYFRIFNPTSQSKKFDANGAYIRKYVPELMALSDQDIHNPSGQQRQNCGYPEAIIDYKQSREQALDWFKSR